MPPRKIGAYEILAVIGRGGIGTVYRARHQRTGEAAAVKLLAPGPAIDAIAALRLAREFEALQDLDHPNVVRVYEAGVADGYPFLAMELIEGLDLRSYLSPTLDDSVPSHRNRKPDEIVTAMSDPFSLGGRSIDQNPAFGVDRYTEEPVTDSYAVDRETFDRRREKRGPRAIRDFAQMIDESETDFSIPNPLDHAQLEQQALELSPMRDPAPPLTPELIGALNRPHRVERMRAVIREVLEGLAYVHRRGLVHRDVKPTNIMVNDQRHPKLMDFGLVKNIAQASPLTVSGKVVGTYRYMSPEQALGDPVDGRSDLYSLGVVIYELLCGKPPFDAKNPVELWRGVTELEPVPILEINDGADPKLTDIARRLLEKSADRRFQTAEEVLEALR